MIMRTIVGNQSLYVSTARNSGTPMISIGNSTVVPQESTGPTASQNIHPTIGAIALSGMPQSLGLISVDGKNARILDSRATNHLTGSSNHFVSYTLYAGNEKIRIADETLAPIAGLELGEDN
ncbi:Beta-galactosidase [Cucumis melo var. makuwa]|uniref:Beta-galactosidase n=1 Tax=Cucumis melo var. makuwa TaxID=1194695 RepID=A0A5D3C362_CUCMM|nr:Beta-galactosidase [Cucumis melo var. makuwa]